MKHWSLGTLLAAAGCLAFSAMAQPPTASRQESQQAVNTVHVSVGYERGVPEADARKVADFLEREYAVLRSRLGFEPTGKIEVRVYETVGRFMAETASRAPWRVAIYSKGALHVQPVSALVQRKLFEKSLRYELCRVFLLPAEQKGCPAWLSESLASEYSKEAEDVSAPLGARLSTFSDLAQDIQDYPDPPQRDDVHYFLTQTMKYFEKTYGESRAYGLFKAFDGSSSVETVFKKVLGTDYATVEKAWAKAMASLSKPFKERGK